MDSANKTGNGAASSGATARNGTPVSIPEFVVSGEAETVQAAILDRYGCTVTLEYAADLVAFIDALTREGDGDA